MIEFRMGDVDLVVPQKSRKNLKYLKASPMASYRAGFFLTRGEESAQLTDQCDWYTLASALLNISRNSQGRAMQNHEIKSPDIPVILFAEKRANHQAEFKNSAKAIGEADMESRVVELETHLKYIRRDMDDVRSDVKSIKHRLAYSAIGTAVVLGVLAWIANSRFDQVVTLLAHQG